MKSQCYIWHTYRSYNSIFIFLHNLCYFMVIRMRNMTISTFFPHYGIVIEIYSSFRYELINVKWIFAAIVNITTLPRYHIIFSYNLLQRVQCVNIINNKQAARVFKRINRFTAVKLTNSSSPIAPESFVTCFSVFLQYCKFFMSSIKLINKYKLIILNLKR